MRVTAIVALLFAAGCASVHRQTPKPTAQSGAPTDVLCGIDVLERDGFRQLAGRRVGLITNQSGLDRDGRPTPQVLAKAGNFSLVCLFSPEHGLYGLVDEKVGDTTDPTTGLHVYSLYGATRKPTDAMLAGVDTLVFDIQDVGARFYTYSATLGLCMEAAAQHHLRFVVLDRPNPVTGTVVSGPIADRSHFGFTAYGPMPVTHGMTFGELAQLYRGAWNVDCDLTVIRMEGWRRSMWYDATGLRWTNPSPNLRNLNAATLYPAICLLEQTNVSVGRGTDQPFEQFGAPWVDARKLAAALNAANLPGLRFVPTEFTPRDGKLKGQRCQGVYVLLVDRDRFEPSLSGITFAWTLYRLFGDQFEVDKVERILQNHEATQALRTASSPADVVRAWQPGLEQFKQVRKKCLIYP